MPNSELLATHITIALALTITVGMQSAELGRFRRGAPYLTAAPTLRIVLWSTPVLALLTFFSGGAVLAEGGRGGPWVGAGILSTLAIGLASVWAHRRLRRRDTGRMGVVGAVQWGVPAVTLAAAFLMADRPQSAVGAAIPVAMALSLTALAYRSATIRPETS